MIRTLLCGISLATLLALGVAAQPSPNLTQSDPGKQSEPATKSVAGDPTEPWIIGSNEMKP